MSKKKMVASIFVILFGIMANVLVILYQIPLSAKDVNVRVGMNSEQGNDIEAFYLKGKQKMPEDFNARQSRKLTYSLVNQDQLLEYKIPADMKYLRLDFGSLESDTKILFVELAYGEKEVRIEQNALMDIRKTNQAKYEASGGEGIQVKSENGDPYIVWDTEEWNLEELVYAPEGMETKAAKIAICVILDAIILVFLRYANKVLSLPRELYQNRKLIMKLSKNDFKTKFAGSYLGIVWAFIQPVVTVLVYWFVFEKGLHASGVNTKSGIAVPFVLWLLAGLVPWFFFSDALSGGTNALIEYGYLVKKVVFKISILPIVKVFSAVFVHLFFVAFTILVYAAYHYYPDMYTLQIIYYSFSMMLFVLGLVYMSCAVVVFFRDLSQIINILLQVGMWMTPIMWNIDGMNLSPTLLFIFKLNPMYYIVTGYRDALINKVWFWENAGLTVYFWLVTVILFGVGTVIFKRLKVHFADVL